MADAIAYCSECGRMVTPVEIRTGQAIVTETVAVCAACVAQLTPQQRTALRKMTDVEVAGPAPREYGGAERRAPGRASGRGSPRTSARASARTSSVRRASGSRRSARLAQMDEEAAGGKSKTGMAIMIGAVGLLFVGVFAFMFLPGEKPDERKQPPPAAAEGAVVRTRPATGTGRSGRAARAPDAATKEKLIEDIQWLIDPSMGKYHDIQEKLDAFLARFPGDSDAVALREQVDRKFGKLAEEALAAAISAAEEFASKGGKAQAVRMINSVASRFGDSAWYHTKGRKAIEEAVEEIGAVEVEVAEAAAPKTATPTEGKAATKTSGAKKTSGAEKIRAAREAILARDFEKARELLAERDGWRDSDREHAEALVAIVADAEIETADIERERSDPWVKFLIGFSEAGKKGLPEVKDYLRRESPALRAADLGQGVTRLGKLVREADLVHDMVLEGLRSSNRPLRFVIGERRFAGRVQSIEGGVIKLKTTIGKQEKVDLAAVPPAELVEKARLMRLGAVGALQLASYYFVLGDIESAGKVAVDLTGEEAPGLQDDVAKLKSLGGKVVVKIELPDYQEPGEAPRADPVADSLVQGLVGYWKLDDSEGQTAADSSGIGNDGVVKGGEWVEGRFKGGFSCKDGGYIEIPNSPSLENVQKGSYSISCWIKTDSPPPEGTGVVVMKEGYHLGLQFERGKFGMQHWWKDGGKVTNRIGSFWDGHVHSTGTWHQVVGVIDKKRAETRLYVGGSRLGVKKWTKTGLPTNDSYKEVPWRIGIGIPGGKQYVYPLGNSIVDEVRIYNRAIDEDEVAALGDPERAKILAAGSFADHMLAGLSKGLVAHWTLDGNAADSSEKGNDGVGRGGGWVDGKFGGAFKPRGGGYVEVPDSDSLKLQKLTISVWLKLDKAIKDMENKHPVVVSMSSWDGKKGFSLSNLDTKVDKLCLTVYSGGRHFNVSVDETEPGKWVHVAGSYDGTHLRIYRDGKEVRSVDIGAKAVDYDKRKLTIGNGLEGLIDDVRIYGRALGEVEVAALVDTNLAARMAATAAARAVGGHRIAKIEAPPGGWPKEPLPGETGTPGQWAPGLITEIFSGHDFKKRIAVRIDPNIEYSFGRAGAGLGLPTDNFSMRWTGLLLLPHEDVYTFEVSADDDLKVYMYGKLLVDKKSKKTAPRRYLAGLYPIVAEHKEWASGASAQFKWSGSTNVSGAIAPEYFYHEVPEPGEYGPHAKLMRGLWAEYYQDEQFRTKVAEGPVDSFNFNIGPLPPHPLCRDNAFGIRMRGYILIGESKQYTLTVQDIDADGGVRLRIGGLTMLDTMSRRGEKGKDTSVKRRIESGYQELVCDYIDGSSDSKLQISLKSWAKARDYDLLLYQDARPLPPIDRDGMAPGMVRQFFAGPKPRGRPIARTYAPAAYVPWKKGKPAPRVPQNKYSSIWQGMLMVPRTGKYLFRAELKGGAFITAGGKKVIMRGKDHRDTAREDGIAPLRAGPVRLQITYIETTGDPGMTVWWAGPTFGFQKLGGGSLVHRAKELAMAELLSEEKAKPPEKVTVVTRDGRVAVVQKKPEKKEPLPVGNVVGNPGFEVMGPESFPQGWSKHNWSREGKYAVRADKSNPHETDAGGKYSLRVRAVGEGGRPGAFTRVTLPPGRYEIRFWACADLEETVKVHVRLGDRELKSATVKEDWEQVKHTFDVTEKVSAGTLGLYTTTANVKVWFDDVELEATKEQPKEE